MGATIDQEKIKFEMNFSDFPKSINPYIDIEN